MKLTLAGKWFVWMVGLGLALAAFGVGVRVARGIWDGGVVAACAIVPLVAWSLWRDYRASR